MEYLGTETISLQEYLEITLDRLSKVVIDPKKFRLQKINRSWEYLQKHSKCLEDEMTILKFRTKVSTGTYIRQIVRDIKDKLEVPLLCNRIHRKEIILS